MNARTLSTLAALLACSACKPSAPAAAPPPVASVRAQAPVAAAPVDPLGPAPEVPTPAPFVPPEPEVWKTASGIAVWLVERHTLPYVAMTLSVPTGSGADPKGRGGLAFATADMLDEGAGSRGSIELSRAIDALGATLVTGATLDASTVSLSVLKRNLAPAFSVFADVIARPRMDPVEWKRVHDLELNDLAERAADPEEVERVVTRATLFGSDHPYGHPVDGTVASSRTIGLGDVVAFYKSAYRPDRACLAVVGDVTKREIDSLLAESLRSWKSPAAPPPPALTPDPPRGPWPRLVLVDRPDAPQAVLSLARPGIAGSDPNAPLVERANLTLGGLFTSRLNQDLREDHGYTYGAGSRVSRTRGVGSFVASASVFTEKAGEALRALVADVADYAKGGMTEAESNKTRLQSRSDRVESFETFDHAAERLAIDAALGLRPDYERTAALASDGASTRVLAELGAQYFDPAHAVVVVVGPRAKLEQALRSIGYGTFELRDTDGKVLATAHPLGRML